MKSLLTITLGLVILLQATSTSLIVLNYQMNMEYIIENFCVNTDKPEMHCNGKCHLKKQIKEESEKRSETPASLTENVTFVLAVEEIPSFGLESWGASSDPGNSLYIEGIYSHQLQSIFRPPKI